MQYNYNGKAIKIEDSEIEHLMKSLEISKEEAIDLWLCDNDYEENEIVEELTEKAKDNKVSIIKGENKRKSSKPREIKVSEEKQTLFSEIFTDLHDVFGENAQIIKENKLISVKINDKTFKIDVIEQRKPKN